MGLRSLGLFMVGMWIMILAVCGFLVIFVAPLETTFFDRLTVSAVQAAIAIVAVIALVLGLSKMKRIYVERKLK